MEEHVHCLKTGPIWRITLNRPDKANALTTVMLARLCDILMEAQADANLKVLHLTGAGSRAFSAGADLSEITANAGPSYFAMWETAAETLTAVPFLTIAALNGACIGGGLVLATACDIRIAVPSTKIGYPVLKNGITPSPSQSQRLRGLIGPSRAALLVMGAREITAQTALAWGLVDAVADDALEMADEISQTAANADAAHLKALKSLMTGTTT